MDAPVPTFTLHVLSHSVGSTQTLSFSDLPITTTVDQLKTKIRERVSESSADETQQRLIHRGRLLRRANETMADLFGADTLKNFPTQSLHLSIAPPVGERPSEPPVPTPTIPRPAGQLPSAQVSSTAASGPYPNAFPRRSEGERAEEDTLEQINHAHAISEAARAYATQRLDINSLLHANNHAVHASIHLQNMQAHGAPQSVRETARTGLQVALENQYQAWQRAYLSSTENERHILSQSYGNIGDGPLLHAIRMGIEYLEAEDHLASSQPEQEVREQESAIVQRDRALQRYQQASQVANAAIGLPPGNTPRLSSPEQRAARHARHHRRAAAAAAANGEPLPVLGHGPNVRPLAAGMLAALVVPHLWIIFKLGIFIYAFTRMDNTWNNIAMISTVAFGIFLYNIGVLERVWTRLMDHVHRLLAVTEPQRIEIAVVVPRDAAVAGAGITAQPIATGNDESRAAPTAAEVRRRATEPTPEAYAQRILDQRQQQTQNQTQISRSAWKEAARMVERDVLLFFLSIVPGVAERHIGTLRAANRAREREQERAERVGEEQEARNGEEREQVVDAPAPADAPADGNAPGAQEAGGFGGDGQRVDGAQQGMPAAVEDETFGGID